MRARTLTQIYTHTHTHLYKMLQSMRTGKKKIRQLCYNLKAKKKKKEFLSPTCQEMSSNILEARVTK